MRREAERLLEEAGRLALRGREAATVETARRMVEAWMDETALGIAWEGRTAWLGNPLQRRWKTGRRGFYCPGENTPDPLAGGGSLEFCRIPGTSGVCEPVV